MLLPYELAALDAKVDLDDRELLDRLVAGELAVGRVHGLLDHRAYPLVSSSMHELREQAQRSR